MSVIPTSTSSSFTSLPSHRSRIALRQSSLDKDSNWGLTTEHSRPSPLTKRLAKSHRRDSVDAPQALQDVKRNFGIVKEDAQTLATALLLIAQLAQRSFRHRDRRTLDRRLDCRCAEIGFHILACEAHHFEGALGFGVVDQPVVHVAGIGAACVDARRRRACLDQGTRDEHLDFLADQVASAFGLGRKGDGVRAAGNHRVVFHLHFHRAGRKKQDHGGEAEDSAEEEVVAMEPTDPEKLLSEVDFDYVPLLTALKAQDFFEADQLTRDGLITLAGPAAVKRGYVYFTDVPKLPADDLATIERLWNAYSGGKFGYTLQRAIYNSKKVSKNLEVFYDRIGWKNEAGSLLRWLPTLKLSRVELVVGASGKADLLIEGHRTDTAPANALARKALPP